MSSAATALTPVPLIAEYGTWVEGIGRTDPEVWRASAREKKQQEATTLDNAIALILQVPTSTLQITDFLTHSPFDPLFRFARGFRFEDGMESEFSAHLTSLVQTYGPFSRDILAQIFEDNTISAEVLSEALRWLGRMEDQPSYEARLWLLEKALSSSSPTVRDGASLGLASMDDPRAARYLEAALERETLPDLRHDMEEVLRQLTNRR